MSKFLEVKKLKTSLYKNKQEIPIVDEIDLEIHRGEVLALVGESGCGKSMTSLSIMKLLPSSMRSNSGEIFLGETNLLQKKEQEMYRIRGNEISMIFQEPMTSLNPVQKISGQLMEGLLQHKKCSKREALEEVAKILSKVGFADPKHILTCYPHHLSGGMRQRVMIAMAILCQPKLIIADEPTTALDVTIQAQIMELLKEIAATYQTAILLITHDLGVVAEIADRVMVMYAGQIVEEAPVEELLFHPQHPYTKGLLASIPSMNKPGQRLYTMPGQVPYADKWPAGCRFASRCASKQDKCLQEAPALKPLTGVRKVRCFLADNTEQHR